MADTDEQTETLIPFGRPIRDLRSALEESLVLEAILEVATDRKTKIRGYLSHYAPDVAYALESFDGYAHEIDGVGTVTVTSPNRKAKIVDRDAFEAWALTTYPERTETRESVDWQVVERAADADPDLRDRLFEILDEIDGAVTVETYLDEKLERDLLKPARTRIVEDDDGSTSVVVKETGERVPGFEAPYASSPALRVQTDPDARSRIAESISGRLPEIATGEAEG